jgi:hypothetical protein
MEGIIQLTTNNSQLTTPPLTCVPTVGSRVPTWRRQQMI